MEEALQEGWGMEREGSHAGGEGGGGAKLDTRPAVIRRAIRSQRQGNPALMEQWR